MLALETVLYCLFYIGLVRVFAWHGPLDALYFYPEDVQERVFALGLADRRAVARAGKRFMIVFMLAVTIAPLLVIGFWNGVREFWPAFWQALVMFETVNWFDGIVIDRLWVAHGKFWILPGLEDARIAKPWKAVIVKRTATMPIWAVVAAIVAGLVTLLF